MTGSVERYDIMSLLYHDVTDNPKDSGFDRKSALPYKITPQSFKEHIDVVSKQKGNVSRIDKLEGKDTIKHILFTFDDGGKSCLYIADLLEKHDYIGHFFITTDYINKKGFLNSVDIKELHGRGHVIGSHSHTHPMIFKSLTFQEMIFEWKHSRDVIENILGERITTCSVPGGDTSKKVHIAAEKSGFKYIFNSEPTKKIKKLEDIFIVGRFSIKRSVSAKGVEKRVNFKQIWYFKLKRRVKKFLKLLFFPVHKINQNNKSK